MPAQQRRIHISLPVVDHVVQRLDAAAARAARLGDWLNASRPRHPLGPDLLALPAPVKAKRGFSWPFTAKPDPEREMKQLIRDELTAAAAGRPRAAQKAVDALPAAEAPPMIEGLRAAS